MVSTDGVAEVSVGNIDYTDHFGIAVVQMMSSYQPSTVAVTFNDLPDGVTVAENVIENMIKARWLQITGFHSGKDVNVIIRNASGEFPPWSGYRQDDSGISVGMVGEKGHAWLGSLKIKSLPWSG
ncbi:fimbria/pilus outer membrane usher protein [Escherichia coli]